MTIATRTKSRAKLTEGGPIPDSTPHSHFLYYDIETVPDPDLPKEIDEDIVGRVSVRMTKDEEKNAVALAEKVAEKREGYSLSPLTCRIVCIAFAFDDEKPRAVYGTNERELLSKFVELVNKGFDSIQKTYTSAGRITPVTFNGLAFDQHILFMKIVQHGVESPRFALRVPKFDKGTNHLDLRMILGNMDQRASGTLGQWAIRLGYAGAKLEHGGGDIAVLFNAGDLNAIKAKCKIDVEIVRFIHSKVRRYL